jgi:ribose transport system substrate-binding protein
MKTTSLAVVAFLLLPASSTGADETIVIGMPSADANHPFHATLQKQAEEEARSLGARIEATDCFNDPFQQTSDVLDFAAKGVKGILLVPMPGVTPAIEAAVKAGAAVVTVGDRADTDQVLLQSGPDNLEVGRLAARFVVEELGNKGSVLEIEGAGLGTVISSGATAATERKAGFDEVIQRSNVKLLASRGAGWNRGLARAAMETMMKQAPSFDAVYAANDDMILGAMEAMSAAGIDPSTKVTVGVDASPAALESIRAGRLSATVDPMLAKQARQAVDYLVGYLKNKTKPPQRIMLIKPELVTRSE